MNGFDKHVSLRTGYVQPPLYHVIDGCVADWPAWDSDRSIDKHMMDARQTTYPSYT